MWKDFKQDVRETIPFAEYFITYSLIATAGLRTGPVIGPTLAIGTLLFSAYKWNGILEEQKKKVENEFLLKEYQAELEKLKAELLQAQQKLCIDKNSEVK